MSEVAPLYPKDRLEELFFSSLGSFTDDFYASVLQAHAEEMPDVPIDPQNDEG